MPNAALVRPQKIAVKRSELRQNQSKLLDRARGRTVLVIGGPNDSGDDKYVLDKEYFEDIQQKYSALVETLEIALDRKLFNQILAVAGTLEADLRRGKLHSFEEAFGEE